MARNIVCFTRDVITSFPVSLVGVTSAVTQLQRFSSRHCSPSENVLTSTGDVKLRAVIQFCQALGKTPTQTFKEVQNAGKYKCCRSLVFRWHKEFREGRESVEDEARSGRPATKRISLVQKVKDRMDRRFTVRTLAADMESSKDTVLRVLHDLNMRKVCARWVPRLLTDVQKAQRVTSSMEFLTRCDEEGDRFLNRIVTQDETWLWHYDPETKADSSVWKTPGTPPPKKAKVSRKAHVCVLYGPTWNDPDSSCTRGTDHQCSLLFEGPVFLQVWFNPVRHKHKFQTKKPRVQRMERRVYEEITKPIIPGKYPTYLKGSCQDPNAGANQPEEVNPYEEFLIKQLKKKIESSKMILICHKMPCTNIRLREIKIDLNLKGMEFSMLNNNHMRTVIEGTELENLSLLLHTDNVLITSPELNVKDAWNILRKAPELVILGGFCQDRLMSKNQLQEYTKLPPIEQLLGELVSCLNLVCGARTSAILNAHQQNLSTNLQQYHKQKSEES